MDMRRRSWIYVASAGLVLSAVGSVPAGAAAPKAPVALRSVRTIDTPLGGNYSTTGTWEPFSSPGIGDVNGDRRPEIVSATVDGTVTATSAATGTVLWRQSLGRFAIHASPVLADLGGDGVADVVIGGMDGRVYWLDGPTGRTVRVFSELPPLYCPVGVDCRPHGFFATPVVADLDRDGRPEIVAASWDHSIYAWKPDGRLVFRTYLEDTLWSSPSVVDIDGDGTREIVLGGDIWNGNPFRVPQGGLLWVLRSNGSPYPGYPRSFPGQVIWSTPAVVDLNGDGALDIVAGTGTHDPFGDGPESRRVYAITAQTGRSLPGWPVQLDGRAVDGPAVGDLDGDGRYDVSIASEGGYVYAFRGNGSRLWRACAAVDGRCGSIATHGSTVIADVDDDGRQEVLTALDQELLVYDGATGAVAARSRFPARTFWPAAAPAVVEIDGATTIVTQTIHQPTPRRGPAAKGDVVRLQLVTTGKPLCRADWPMFKRSPDRNAVLAPGGVPFAPFACVRPFVAQQYRDFLARDLDAAGLAFWSARLNRDWTGPQVIQSLMDSPEFGRVRSPLVRVHLALTDRPPRDPAAFTIDAGRLQSGTPLATIAAEIAASPTTTDRAGRVVSAKDDATFVADAYRHAVGRGPTASEAAAALAAVRGPLGRGGWAASLASSGSAVRHLRSPVYVTMSYLGMLGRMPERAGYDFWVPRVRSGVSIRGLIYSFQTSAEYRRRVL